MIKIAEKIVYEIKKIIGKNLTSAVVFGSAARGDYKADSDIDMLIIAKNLPKSRFERLNVVYEAEKRVVKKPPPFISVIIKTEEEAKYHSPIYLDMVEDAVILYDENNFFKNILDEIKKRLKELGAKRIYIGNKWYWDLKPDYKWGEEFEI